MNCAIKPLSERSETFALLMRYINASHTRREQDSMVVQNIFSVGSKSSIHDPELFTQTHNHTMLLHGTSNANLISILEQGLQLKPRNAAFYHGSVFGEGIYFAD